MIAFILTVVVCFVMLLAGFPLVLEFIGALFPQGAVDAIASLSFLTHFTAIARAFWTCATCCSSFWSSRAG